MCNEFFAACEKAGLDVADLKKCPQKTSAVGAAAIDWAAVSPVILNAIISILKALVPGL